MVSRHAQMKWKLSCVAEIGIEAVLTNAKGEQVLRHLTLVRSPKPTKWSDLGQQEPENSNLLWLDGLAMMHVVMKKPLDVVLKAAQRQWPSGLGCQSLYRSIMPVGSQQR